MPRLIVMRTSRPVPRTLFPHDLHLGRCCYCGGRSGVEPGARVGVEEAVVGPVAGREEEDEEEERAVDAGAVEEVCADEEEEDERW